MTNFHFSIFILLFAVFMINSCKGQVNTTPAQVSPGTTKPVPKIVGTPPQMGNDFGFITEPGLVSQYIRCIFQDSKGNYWFGPAGQSVARYDGETLEFYSRIQFFQGNKLVSQDYGNSVHAMAEDHHGNIWFGTEYGVVKYDPSIPPMVGGNNFRSYTQEHGLSSTRIGRSSIVADKSGNIWVGTEGGVFKYQPAADTVGGQCFIRFDLIPSVSVNDIFEDNNGNIWFALKDKGIFRYTPPSSAKNEKPMLNLVEKEGLGDDYAGGIAQDNEGKMWFTMKGGVCRYDPSLSPGDPNAFTELTTKDGLGGDEVWGIFIEQSGIIWITARGSTTRYDPSVPKSDPKAFTVFTPDDGINCCVQSMYQDRSGQMWWGSGSGLFRFDGTRFYQVKQDGPW